MLQNLKKERKTSPGRTRSDRHVQPQSTSLNCKKYDKMREKCSCSVQQKLISLTNSYWFHAALSNMALNNEKTKSHFLTDPKTTATDWMIVEVCLRLHWFPTLGKSVPDYGLWGTINICTTGTNKVKTGIGKINVTN